jgi:hypothetical protein
MKNKVAELYSSNSLVFPVGNKLSWIPTISSIISKHSKQKYGLVIAKQAAFLAKVSQHKQGNLPKHLAGL